MMPMEKAGPPGEGHDVTKTLQTISGWLLDEIDKFDAAHRAGDSVAARNVFLAVVNRCAQEGHFRELVGVISRQTSD